MSCLMINELEQVDTFTLSQEVNVVPTCSPFYVYKQGMGCYKTFSLSYDTSVMNGKDKLPCTDRIFKPDH